MGMGPPPSPPGSSDNLGETPPLPRCLGIVLITTTLPYPARLIKISQFENNLLIARLIGEVDFGMGPGNFILPNSAIMQVGTHPNPLRLIQQLYFEPQRLVHQQSH